MKFEPESRCGVSCAAFPCEILMEYKKQPGKAGCVENCRRIKAEWVEAAASPASADLSFDYSRKRVCNI